MVRQAMSQGIVAAIATPHAPAGNSYIEPELIKLRCRQMMDLIRRKYQRDFLIFPGEEIYYSQDTVRLLNEGKILTLAGSRYVLVEFAPGESETKIRQAVLELVRSQYRPIIAHVERYQALRGKEVIPELIRMGAYLQMNYRPIGGKWYSERTRWCRNTIRKGQIDFLATDAHNTTGRSPEIKEAVRWLETHLEEAQLQRLCCGNARKIIEDKE